MDIKDLENGARLHRKHARKLLSEYKRNFVNAEYFVVFPDDDNNVLIEPLGWALRALEPEGLKMTRAVPPQEGKRMAQNLGLEVIDAKDPRFDRLWSALIEWTKAKKMKPLSTRNQTDRKMETFFFVKPDP